MTNFKPEPANRCEEYLAWIRSQPSVESGERGCVAHHVLGNRYGTLKTSDFLAIPLTDLEHKRLHQDWREWERLHGPQRAHSAELLDRAISLGLFSADTKAMRRAAQSEVWCS